VSETRTIVVPELRRIQLNARIEGVTPLIVHRFGEKAMRLVQRSQSGEARQKKEPRDPESDFQEALYKLPDGSYGFPSIGVKKAMVLAGQRFAEERGTELYGAITIPGEFLTIESPAPPRRREDRVVLQGKTLDIAYRPEFWPWAMVVPLVFYENMISPDRVINLLRVAGTCVGIGNWRMDRKGVFGSWDVGHVEQVG
jgi:hypothetical protein